MSKERWNLIKQITNENRDLGTTVNNKRYTLNDVNVLVNKIAKNQISKDKSIEFYNVLVKKAEQISKLRFTPPRQKMLEIFGYLQDIFNEPKKNDKKPDTTHMPELESEEFDAQRKNQQRQRLKTLSPNQMLSRLTISLAQLKAGNNSKKLENEIRQQLLFVQIKKTNQQSTIIWSTLFKHGSNLYEHWK